MSRDRAFLTPTPLCCRLFVSLVEEQQEKDGQDAAEKAARAPQPRPALGRQNTALADVGSPQHPPAVSGGATRGAAHSHEISDEVLARSLQYGTRPKVRSQFGAAQRREPVDGQGQLGASDESADERQQEEERQERGQQDDQAQQNGPPERKRKRRHKASPDPAAELRGITNRRTRGGQIEYKVVHRDGTALWLPDSEFASSLATLTDPSDGVHLTGLRR